MLFSATKHFCRIINFIHVTLMGPDLLDFEVFWDMKLQYYVPGTELLPVFRFSSTHPSFRSSNTCISIICKFMTIH
jgi:hypothetical protein